MADVKKFNIKATNVYVIGVAAFFFVLLLVVALVLSLQQVSEQDSSDDALVSYPALANFTEGVEVKNESVITLAEKTVTLPEGWDVNYAYRNTAESKLRCTDLDLQETCVVYEVTDGSNYFLLSSPTSLYYEGQPLTSSVTKTIMVANEEVDFKAEQYYQELRTDDSEGGESQVVDDEDSVLYSRIYGCFQPRLCLNTQLLPEVPEENKASVAAFYNLAEGLKIQ